MAKTSLPQSMKLSDLTAQIKMASTAINLEQPGFLPENPRITFAPKLGIVGYVVQNDRLATRNFTDVSKLSRHIGDAIGPTAAFATGALDTHHTIVGFVMNSHVLEI